MSWQRDATKDKVSSPHSRHTLQTKTYKQKYVYPLKNSLSYYKIIPKGLEIWLHVVSLQEFLFVIFQQLVFLVVFLLIPGRYMSY